MRIPILSVSALARLATRLALAVACAAPLAPVEVRLGVGDSGVHWSALRAADAQQGREMISGPVTTVRFARLASLYLAPTDDEMDALDRVHGAYLERFRTEIVPEIEALVGTLRGSMPSKAEFEKFLRDLERVEAKVADADRAFLDAAAELVAEERRDGMVRIRDARERQRLRSGLARMAPMVAGGGSAAFVDLADLIAREEYALAVDEAQREAFDAILRGLESRALIQARAYHAAAGDTFSAYFDIAVGMQAEMEAQQAAAAASGAEDGGAAAMQASMQAMMERMRAIGEPVAKAVRANHAANRSALAQLNGILPEEIHLAVREEVATRTLGMMRYGVMGTGGIGDVRGLFRRIARDRRLDDATRAAAAEIGLRWRRDTLVELEKLADDAAEGRGALATVLMAGMMGDGEGELAGVGRRLEDLGQRTLRELQSLLGAEESNYITRIMTQTPDGERERLDAAQPSKEPEADETSDESGGVAGATYRFAHSVPPPIGEQDVLRLARLAGVGEDGLAIVEPIARDAFERAAKEGNALRERHAAIQQRAWRAVDGSVEFDATASTEAYAVLREALTAVLAADRALRTDLAAALGLAEDHPFLVLLELERLPAVAADGWTGDSSVVHAARVLVAAKATPDEVASFLAAGRDAWRALAAEIPSLGEESVGISAEVMKSMNGFGAGNSPADNERAMEAQQNAQSRMQEAHDALATKVADAFERSIADGIADPEAARRLRGAYRRIAYPRIFERREDLQPVLASACELRDLSDRQIARLEVLRSQYADRFDALSAEMVELARGGGPGAQDEESWEAFAQRQAKSEDLRFRRKEATEKARAAAIRILGPARAEDVRGLVLDDEARRAAREERGGFDMFGEADDD